MAAQNQTAPARTAPPQQKPGNGAPAAQEPKKEAAPAQTFQQFLEQRKVHLAAVAEGMVDPEKLIKLAMLARTKNPALQDCSFESIWLSLLGLAESGLEPDGVEAALVPYKGACTGQPMYRGICKLLYSSGMVKDVYADVFYANEVAQGRYRYRKGSKPSIQHEPLLDDRGDVAGAYAVIHTITGGTLVDQMSVADIERIRKFSKATYSGNPWDTHWNEQAKKTVLKRIAKVGPQSKQLRAVARLEGEEIEGEVLSREEMPRGTAGLKAAVARQLSAPTQKEHIEHARETVAAVPHDPVTGEVREAGSDDGPSADEIADVQKREAEEAAQSR